VSRSWQLFLRDMLEAARRVIRYTEGREVGSFVADEMAYDAALRNLEILGAAAKNIPEEIRQSYPDVDWRGVAGLRDVLAHAYLPSTTPLSGRLFEPIFPNCSSCLDRSRYDGVDLFTYVVSDR